MKKIFVFLLAMTMLFSLAACGKTDPTPSSSNDPGTSQQQPSETPDDSTPADGEGERWGDHDITVYFPAPPADKVDTKITSSTNSISYNMTWTPEEAKAYIEQCESAGFSGSENVNSGITTWTAKTSDKSMYVVLSYSDSNSGMLQVRKSS